MEHGLFSGNGAAQNETGGSVLNSRGKVHKLALVRVQLNPVKGKPVDKMTRAVGKYLECVELIRNLRWKSETKINCSVVGVLVYQKNTFDPDWHTGATDGSGEYDRQSCRTLPSGREKE